MSIDEGVVAGWSQKQADCRLFFEGNALPMWVFSARVMVDVNRAALLHYDFSRDEFLTMSVEDFEATASLSEGRVIGRHKKKDGSVIEVELSSFAITFGGMPATLWSASDVTCARRIAAQTHGLDLLLGMPTGVDPSDVRPTIAGGETLRAVLANTIATQEGERRRIARELDDETAQTLTSVLVGLRTIEEARDLPGAREGGGNLRVSVAAALEGIHRIACGLRPSILDQLGLEPALELLAAEVSREGGFSVDFHVTGAPGLRIPEPMEIALYRIAEEALTNTARHASAKTVSVLIHRNDDTVRLVVEDDGRGFDVAAPPSETQLGLIRMHERAHFIGGSMTLRSSVGRGTTLRVSAPLPPSAPVSARLLS